MWPRRKGENFRIFSANGELNGLYILFSQFKIYAIRNNVHFLRNERKKKKENLESHVNVVFTLIGHFRIRSVYIHIYNNLSLEIPLMEGSIPLEIIHNRFISVFAMKIRATVKLLDSPLMNSNIMSNQWLSKLWYRQMTLPSQLFLVNSKNHSRSSPGRDTKISVAHRPSSKFIPFKDTKMSKLFYSDQKRKRQNNSLSESIQHQRRTAIQIEINKYVYPYGSYLKLK